jgi:iron complex transport system ATP-binding protein
MLQVETLSWGTSNTPILQNIDLEVASGEFVGIIGPNGSGKSSLLRCIYRVLKPDTGRITFNGTNIWHRSPRELAKQVAVVLQETATEFDFTVAEVVAMGRFPYQELFGRESQDDQKIIHNALAQVGLDTILDRNFSSLSGGEKQRVLVARAIAQQPQLLILDEPTNHLDIRYQLELMELVKALGITTIAALHDLNLAATYCDRLYVLNQGKVIAQGHPTEVLSPDLIHSVYQVGAEVQTHPKSGKLNLAFFPKSVK